MKDETSDVAVTFENAYSETPVASPAPSAPLYIPGVGFAKPPEENIHHDGVDNAGMKIDEPPLPPPRVQSEPIKTQISGVSQNPEAKSAKPWRKISGRWTIVGFAVMLIMLMVLFIVTIVSLTRISNIEEDINEDVLKRLPPFDCDRAINKFERRRVFLPEYEHGVTVYCDGITDGGGWLIFQHRSWDSISFDQSLSNYVNGFGTAGTDYWLGLKMLHELTSQQEYELRVHLINWCGDEEYAYYLYFRVESSDEGYRLRISGYQGNLTNALSSSNGRRFVVANRNSFSCESNQLGGWWYSSSCTESNLNGEYINRYSHSFLFHRPCYDYYSPSRSPMFWNGFYGSNSNTAAIRTSVMMIRPRRN